MKKKLLFLTLISIIFTDQISKYFITKWYLTTNSSTLKELISGVFEIAYVQNSGIAFGIPLKGLIFNIIISIILIALTIFIFSNKKIFHPFILNTHPLALIFILAGGIGNLIDRFRLGYVVDFISFSFWPAFNVADITISIGTILFLYINFLKREK